MLDRLPNELIYLILAHLSSSSPPPSYTRLQAPPSPDIVRAAASPLKELVQTSPHLAELVRPLLFAHCCCHVDQLEPFLSFGARFALHQKIVSIVVISTDDLPPDHNDKASSSEPGDDRWWCRLLQEINPMRLTFVAPPVVIGKAMATYVMNEHNWAFEILFQTLSLEQDDDQESLQKQSQGLEDPWPTLLHARLWKSVSFNESSSLKAYNHYEYFRSSVPSILNSWGNAVPVQHRTQTTQSALDQFAKITHFRYTAVFPFYNHTRAVLGFVRTAMPQLRSLSVQLAPARDDRAIEREQRGSMDPNDPWMELSTGYDLIAKVVRSIVQIDDGPIERFQTCDYEIEDLRESLSTVIGDVLSWSQWEHDGHGIWIKKTGPTTTLTNS